VKERTTTLPLGIDIGGSRVRVALTDVYGHRARLIAVASRDHGGDVDAAIGTALDELQTPERRCVFGIGSPDAVLRQLHLPQMPPWERMRAARFEATHVVDYPIRDAAISLAALPEAQGWVLGIARRSAIARVLGAARRHRLRPVAIDDASLALHRALPGAACIVDIGHASTRITMNGAFVPFVTDVPIGGDHLTEAIARALGLDAVTAERRKRQIGFGGAGESERDTLVSAIVEAIGATTLSDRPDIDEVVLCGNGARIPGLASALSDALGIPTALARLPAESSDTLPTDILRVAGADWSTAYGLSLWSTAS
jgi:type IV pilus assembly protein PilM